MTTYTAAASYRNDKRDIFKGRAFLKKMADRSLLKRSLGYSHKKIIVYEARGEKYIDVLDDEDESANKRASMRFDTLFVLQTILPSVLTDLEESGKVGEDVRLEDQSLLYFTTSKFFPPRKSHMKPSGRIYANIRYKYYGDDGTLMMVSSLRPIST